MSATGRVGGDQPTAVIGGRRPRQTSWQGAGVALLVIGWGANQFVALLPLYHQRLGITALGDDLGVSLYAAGLIPALLVTVTVGDNARRRRLALVALLLTAASSAILMVGSVGGFAALLVGRVVAGAGTGVALSGLTTWVKELSAVPYDLGSDVSAGARRIVVCLSGGFAGGPLAAAAVAQWSPLPLVAPSLVQLLATAAVVPLVLSSPETSVRDAAPARPPSERDAWCDPHIWLPQLPLAPWVFGAAMTSIAVLGSFAGHGPLLAGALAAVTLLAGAAAQPIGRQLLGDRDEVIAAAGCSSIAVAFLLATAARNGALPEVLCAAVLFGAGYGLCHLAGLLRAERLARPGNATKATAAFYLVAYSGMGGPVLITWLAGRLGYGWVLTGAAAAALTAVALCASRLDWRHSYEERTTSSQEEACCARD